jgi:proteasome alpha subunit
MMDTAMNEMMEYDRSNVMFAPDGRLIQVEYARKTVSQGSLTLGFTCSDGVLILAEKRTTNGLIKNTEKIMQIDEHLGAAMSGLISDGRILIESAQSHAQSNRITYDTPIDVMSLVKHVCSFKQAYTQFAGYRPFGVSVMIAGVDEAPRLFVTEPSGIYFGYRASALGEKSEEAKNLIKEQYKDGMSMTDAAKLGMKILAQLTSNFSATKVDSMYITTKDKQFRRFTDVELKKFYSK